jgi:cyclic lactone autoinducer peptide
LYRKRRQLFQPGRKLQKNVEEISRINGKEMKNMFKKIRKSLLTYLASMITLVAFTAVSPHSIWILYEPDIPDALKKTY